MLIPYGWRDTVSELNVNFQFDGFYFFIVKTTPVGCLPLSPHTTQLQHNTTRIPQISVWSELD